MQPESTQIQERGPATRSLSHLRAAYSQWIVPLLALLCFVAILYQPVRSYDYSIIDDHINVYQNPYLCAPKSQNIAYFWTHPYFKLYMPLTYTLWALVARTAQLTVARTCPPGDAYTTLLDPGPFHTLSLTLHLANCVLVFAILARLRFRPLACAAGAALFAVHPNQVQAVAWITGANNLLGAFFGFSALLLYLLSISEPGVSGVSVESKSRHLGWLCAASLAFACALLSKPTTVVMPLFLVIIETIILRRSYRRWIVVVVVWLALAAVCVLVNSLASSGGDAAGQVWSPLWGRGFVAGDALAFYMSKLVWPAYLTYDYVRKPSVILSHGWGYITWLAPALVLAGLIRYRPRAESLAYALNRSLCAAALVFLAGLLPSLGIVPFYAQFLSTVWNHYLYLALLGPSIGVAAICSWQTRARHIVGVAVFGGLAFLAVETQHVLPVWTNMSTLTASMLAESPESALAHHNRGLIRGAAGDLAGAIDEFRAEVDLQRRLQHNANASGNASYTLGMTMSQMGRFSEAVEPLRAAFSYYPSQPDYWYGLWTALMQCGRIAEADGVVRAHLRAAPDDVRANVTLGKALLARGDAADATPLLETAARLDSHNAAIFYFLGSAYEHISDNARALGAYEQASKLDPAREVIREAITRLRHGN